MPSNVKPSHETLISQFEAAGQGHVFEFYDGLEESLQEKLVAQAGGIDLEELQRLVHSLVLSQKSSEGSWGELEPCELIASPVRVNDASLKQRWTEAREKGEQAIREGLLAAFTVAGGQGTRLGFDAPKGTFPVTPLSKKSLFEVFAEKLKAAQKRYEVSIPWFLMTSEINHEPTVAFFEEHDFFGLDETDVHFFRQGLMPAVNEQGKILLQSRHKIAMSPDGHGGSLRALVRSGSIKAMQKKGKKLISYFQVDNPLVQIIDPAFVGFHLLGNSEMSSKAVMKTGPEEKMGVFCQDDGKLKVIEYSDLPEDLMHERDDSGDLKYGAGSIAIHLIDLDFVQKIGEGGGGNRGLPFHCAYKKVPFVNHEGEQVSPESPNGYKFETFVFDAIPDAGKSIVIETDRAKDFSPVKNACGVDSPESSAQHQMRLFATWFAAAGVELACDAEGVPVQKVEVSPLFATDAESFAASWAALSEKPDLAGEIVL